MRWVDEMDVGVIGTGNMGQNHARVYSEMRGVNQIYIFDVDTERGKGIAKKVGAESCSSIEELLSKVDSVDICVPTSKHFEVAEQVINKGVNFLVEKPIALTVEEGKKLAEMAGKEDLITGVGHIERFNPVVRQIKKIMKNPLYLEIKRHNPGSSRINDTDVVTDLMVHDIDIAWNYLFSGIEARTMAVSGLRKNGLDFVTVNAHMGGTLVNLSASRFASKKIRRILIEEEDCTIEGDLIGQEIYIHKNPKDFYSEAAYRQENVVEKVSVSREEPLRKELSLFLGCVKERKPFEVSLDDGVRVLEVASEIVGKAVC